MKKNRFIYIIVISLLFLTGYFISIMFQSDLWANIFSSITTFIAAGILIICVQDKTQSALLRRIRLYYTVAILAWAVGDTLWLFYDLIPQLDPEESLLISSIYPVTNIFLVLGVITYGHYVFKKWNLIQLIIDGITIVVATGSVLWIVFFEKNLDLLELMKNDLWTSWFSILIDVIIIIAIAIWYFSIRKGYVTYNVRIISTSILLFVLTDLYYYYLYYYNIYTANTLVDALYLISLLFLALGAYLGKVLSFNMSAPKEEELNYSSLRFKRKSFMLLLGILIIYLKDGFSIWSMSGFLILTLLHLSISIYVQMSIQNQIMLKKEKEINHILEKMIEERTKEIVEKNHQLEEKNKELNFISNQDTVTNLYNRRYFIKNLEETIQQIKESGQSFTVGLLFIDLDRFKTINDAYGHYIGDQLLIEIGKRLKSVNHGNSILARLGGDEFVIGFRGKFRYQHMKNIAEKIIKKCNQPIEIEQNVFHVGVSVGIAMYPNDSLDVYTLMKNADIAMYQAKALGSGICVTYDSIYTNILLRKNDIELLLRNVNFSKEFQLYYQPQYSIPDKKLVGAEALLRWNTPQCGYIPPSEFIPIAEEMNYINPIGEWVIKQVISQISQWNKKYKEPIRIGINLSPKQLDNKDLIGLLKNTLEEFKVLPKQIDIEITESIAIEGEYRIEQIHSLFEGLGVSISIDDFGTGYSSLSYLKIFPFERIKIAKPLIDAIASVNFDLQIVKAIILLAKSIGIRTIAEGVETIEQYNILVELGCDEIQGYYLGRPVPANEFEGVLWEGDKD